jgi:hypothetical protein
MCGGVLHQRFARLKDTRQMQYEVHQITVKSLRNHKLEQHTRNNGGPQASRSLLHSVIDRQTANV